MNRNPAGARKRPAADGKKLIVSNRRARYEYEVLETVEAGLVLTGTEIKSIRGGHVQIQDSYARVEDGEVWLHHMHVAPYEKGSRFNVEPLRRRKLLLKRTEIDRLLGKAQERGLTLVPLSLYLRNGYAKVELAIARGRKLYDRRRAIAEREARREAERALGRRE